MPHSFGIYDFHGYEAKNVKFHLFTDITLPPSEQGIFGLNTSNHEVQFHNGSNFIGLVDKSSSQVIAGHKTFGQITLNGVISGSYFETGDLFAATNASSSVASVSAIISAINDSTLDTEQIQDAAAAMIVNGLHSQLSVSYDDVGNTLNFTIPNNHPAVIQAADTSYTGAQVTQNLDFDSHGHVIGVTSKTITPALIGAQPAGSYDNYSSWTVSDGINTELVNSGKIIEFAGGTNVSTSLSSGVLTINASHYNVNPGSLATLSGASVISNIDVDINGHATTFTTRDLTPGDIGAAPSHSHPYLPLTGGTLTGDLNIGEDGSPADLHIWGDIIQEAGVYEVHAEQVYTSQEQVILREDSSIAIGAGVLSGIRVTAYDGTNDLLFGTSNDGWFKIGEPGFEQLIATRDDNANIGNNNLLMLDEASNMLVDTGIHYTDVVIGGNMTYVAYTNVNNNFTVNQSISGNTVYHQGNLTTAVIDALNINADNLDGQHGAYYLDYNNFTNIPSLSQLHSPVDLSTNDSGVLSLLGQTLTFNGSDLARRNMINTFTQNQTFNGDIIFGGAGTHYFRHGGGTASTDKMLFGFSDGQTILELDGSGKVKANAHFDSVAYKLGGTTLYLDHLKSLEGSVSVPELLVSDGSQIMYKTLAELSNSGLTYTKTIPQISANTTFLISETEHNCGTEPDVSFYLDQGTGTRIHALPETIEIESNGDVTITFGEAVYGYIKILR